VLNGSAQLPALDGSLLTNTGNTAVQTGTPSAVANFSISSLVAGARYKLIMSLVKNTSAGTLTMTFNDDVTSGHYNWAICHGTGSAAAGGSNASDTAITLSVLTLGIGTPFAGELTFFPSAATNNNEFVLGQSFSEYSGDGAYRAVTNSGMYLGSAATSKVTFTTSAGTLTGAWYLYRLS
jgi:hypothetical protein